MNICSCYGDGICGIEELKVVLTLLYGPKNDEDTNIVPVLLEKHASDLFADTGSHKSAVTVDHGVNGDNNVDWKHHRHNEVALRLNVVNAW